MSAGVTAQSNSHPRLLGSLLESTNRKSPLIVAAYYSEANNVLNRLPTATHPVWATLKHQLETTTSSQRSKVALLWELEAACVKEDLDWKMLDIVKRACKVAPQMIDLVASKNLLFKLMGALRDGEKISWDKNAIYGRALAIDDDLAESIFRFLRLLELVQKWDAEENRLRLKSLLRLSFQKMKSLLEKNRGAPEIRQFLDTWGQSAGSESEECDDVETDGGIEEEECYDDETDGGSEEEERASKRRCSAEQ